MVYEKYYFSTQRTYTETSGNWALSYEGYPATSAGEYDTATFAKEYTHTFSGSLNLNLKKEIQISLGYSFGTSKEFAVSKNSSALKKGEYIKAYWRKNYNVSQILQTTEHRRLTEITNSNGQHIQQDVLVSTDKETLYAKEAIMPQIKLEYYINGKLSRSNKEVITREEIYEFIDGNYQLVSTTEK